MLIYFVPTPAHHSKRKCLSNHAVDTSQKPQALSAQDRLLAAIGELQPLGVVPAAVAVRQHLEKYAGNGTRPSQDEPFRASFGPEPAKLLAAFRFQNQLSEFFSENPRHYVLIPFGHNTISQALRSRVQGLPFIVRIN